MKTLVLGVGNPILSDDGAGIYVARALMAEQHHSGTTIAEVSASGLDLLDCLVGYDRAIIIDAVQSENAVPGRISRFSVEAMRTTMHLSTMHGVDFATALELGRRLGLRVPDSITIFGIEARDVTTFSETCSPEIARAVPICAEMVKLEMKVAVAT